MQNFHNSYFYPDENEAIELFDFKSPGDSKNTVDKQSANLLFQMTWYQGEYQVKTIWKGENFWSTLTDFGAFVLTILGLTTWAFTKLKE